MNQRNELEFLKQLHNIFLKSREDMIKLIAYTSMENREYITIEAETYSRIALLYARNFNLEDEYNKMDWNLYAYF